jgi:FKBP-type peptidyl-prolyl cis-trans isomerase
MSIRKLRNTVPEKGQNIHACYEGRLESGKVFASSPDPENAFSFDIGTG